MKNSGRTCAHPERREKNIISLDIMAKELDSGLEVNGFELPLSHHIYFRSNTLGKDKNILILQAMV